ncbi:MULTISPECIES: enoyl-CoA hydratase/isomerase family protein [unclassified Streptomyces]|uniref:WXG100 family type VII secretion target n=1 Tax=unclassified Streptomyces TaxID=2593676 RepID=UPI002E80AC3E|nr:enoyl-CoA hydratase/isomerase family protein [Streptomyces sp. NBC_00589]WTI37097.1 WXG100 family type VII secretion target [Streptomyces sp. NBC_00775]WUB29227.1 WXG100 family type VII secretion target [Streptomyces sp. NBC_00589]
MGRPAFPHIGWDPTPGDVEQTRDLAKKLGGLAGELGTALRELKQIETGAWKGKTAIAFSEHISTDVTPLIKKSHDSFDKASRALHRWAGQLADFQDEADRLEKDAGEKLDAKAEAQQKADQKGDGKGSEELGKASGAVDKVTSDVHDLEDRYKKAAHLISKDLDKAADIAPDEPGFWDKLGDGIANAWDGTADWVKDHADLIKEIGDVLSDITAVLGVLAIITLPFEPLGAIFGAAAVLTSGLALLAHGVAMAGGADVSWLTMGTDALGLLPGIGLFGKGAKVANEAAAELRIAEFGKGFSASRIESAFNVLATGDMAASVKGGIGLLSRKIVLGGTAENIGLLSSESGTMNRLAGLAEAGYHQGQWLGTKGAALFGERFTVDPLSTLGRGIDVAGKVLPKGASILLHSGDSTSPGDRLHQSATAH